MPVTYNEVQELLSGVGDRGNEWRNNWCANEAQQLMWRFFAWFDDNAPEGRVGVLLSAPRPVSPPRSLSPTPGPGPVRSLVRLAGNYFADGCVCLFAATPDEFCGGNLAMEVRGACMGSQPARLL